ncbi:hypothetical protein [Cohnella silvisoli]|uniref:Uncharacterized protein n=1 Tax=Cohnella silvisoli TaxID=2873699 RepID=A0ABV1KXZ1_9BACL|nr:hypothetical protein [Cohnella silvisoli]
MQLFIYGDELWILFGNTPSELFTYITGIALGNIAGETVLNKEIKVVAGITAMTMWALLTIIIEQLSLKSPMIRVLFDGEPAIVIKNGKIQRKAMALSKLNG